MVKKKFVHGVLEKLVSFVCPTGQHYIYGKGSLIPYKPPLSVLQMFLQQQYSSIANKLATIASTIFDSMDNLSCSAKPVDLWVQITCVKPLIPTFPMEWMMLVPQFYMLASRPGWRQLCETPHFWSLCLILMSVCVTAQQQNNADQIHLQLAKLN